jgi:hypothetical protein
MKKNMLYALVSVLLIAALALAGCGGNKSETTTSPTTTAMTQTTKTTSTTPTTTTTTTATAPTSTTQTTTTTTPTSTTQTTATTSTTTTKTTTTPTTTTQTTTTTTGTSLNEILGHSAGIASMKYDMVITSTGSPAITSKVWIKMNSAIVSKMRTEVTSGGQTVITLLDYNARTMYMYMPALNMAYSMTFNPTTESAVGEAQSVPEHTPTIIGHETLDGKVCLVVEYTDKGTTTREWIWEQYGFPIKIVVTSAEGTVTTEFKNIDFGNIDDSVFVLPAGVQMMTMPAA